MILVAIIVFAAAGWAANRHANRIDHGGEPSRRVWTDDR